MCNVSNTHCRTYSIPIASSLYNNNTPIYLVIFTVPERSCSSVYSSVRVYYCYLCTGIYSSARKKQHTHDNATLRKLCSIAFAADTATLDLKRCQNNCPLIIVYCSNFGVLFRLETRVPFDVATFYQGAGQWVHQDTTACSYNAVGPSIVLVR